MNTIHTIRKLFVLIMFLTLISCQKNPTSAYDHITQPATLYKQHEYNHPPPHEYPE